MLIPNRVGGGVTPDSYKTSGVYRFCAACTHVAYVCVCVCVSVCVCVCVCVCVHADTAQTIVCTRLWYKLRRGRINHYISSRCKNLVL